MISKEPLLLCSILLLGFVVELLAFYSYDVLYCYVGGDLLELKHVLFAAGYQDFLPTPIINTEIFGKKLFIIKLLNYTKDINFAIIDIAKSSTANKRCKSFLYISSLKKQCQQST